MCLNECRYLLSGPYELANGFSQELALPEGENVENVGILFRKDLNSAEFQFILFHGSSPPPHVTKFVKSCMNHTMQFRKICPDRHTMPPSGKQDYLLLERNFLVLHMF